MRAESEAARDELRRRLRNVVRVIDEALSLHGRRTGAGPLRSSVTDVPERSDSARLAPHVSSEAEVPSERRRRELQEERESAQRRLESLKRARERRGRRSETTPDGSDASGPLLAPLHSSELDPQRQPPAPLQLLLPTAPDSPVAADIGVKQSCDAWEGGRGGSSPREAQTQVAVLEEEFRKRFAERCAEEESRLEELRTVRRSAMAARQKALAEAQAQIERAESERVAKLLQIQNEMERSLAASQERCIPTEAEVRAIGAHEEALAALRAHTGIGAASPSPVCHSPSLSTSVVARSASCGGSSPQRRGASLKPTRSPPLDGVLSSATPPQADYSPSPLGPEETSPPSPRRSPHTAAVSGGSGSPAGSFAAGKGTSGSRTPSPSLPFPPPATLSVAAAANDVKEVPLTAASPTGPPQERFLFSPSVTSSALGHAVSNPPARSLLPSQFLSGLRRRGLLADVLPSGETVIPTLVRLSKDGREVLLLVERLERALACRSRTPPTSLSQALPSSSSALSRGMRRELPSPRKEGAAHQQQEQQQRGKSKLDVSSTRRVREIYHVSLVDGFLLYPHGVIGVGATGSVSSIICGTRARQLLIEHACTLFELGKTSPYCLALVSPGPPHHKNEAAGSPLPHRRSQSDLSGATLLLLRFRCRWDWVAFLVAVAATTTQWRGTPPLSYGRALWMLAAQLWRRQRNSLVLSAPTKHYRGLPVSVLSFTPVLKPVAASSAGTTSASIERSKYLRAAPARFAVPPPCDWHDSNEDDYGTTSRVDGRRFARGAGALPTGHRSRFGVRPLTTSNGCFSRHSSASATRVGNGY
ncbi:uncharacterized protein Tco025E_06962 [Trypanosoma conorhini]|uniref:Uncharacterized protein n=1 Tax=Trypanosoma conorhini TaxID=83891 RepID=A0A422NVQ7_9TRYP|nr:uncharacterized protein Tco025E_06962 [Trypanosoma conorhini]RNF09536.1 hypothetical protein Tco025E_06962 [Trypanosoma conorhini]